MPISSSSVFHFTRTKAALKGILQNNFKVKYCLENLCFESRDRPNAIPMVSFCDIPLSQVKDHIGKYGSYGIGLTKEWAADRKLSPVQYVATGSIHALAMEHLIYHHVKSGQKFLWEDMTDTQRSVFMLATYLKNYEGDLVRRGKTSKTYRFYDEREWRYVPESNGDFPITIAGDRYETSSQKSSMNRLISDLRLTFNPSDIKYIIVRSEKEISEFVEVIRNSKGKSYSLRETERLTTRIITKEQIESDF